MNATTAPVIPHGDGAGDAQAYQCLVSDHRTHDGVAGAVGEHLLERLASLIWRLRRVARIGTAIATQPTICQRWRAGLARLREAGHEIALARLGGGLLRTANGGLLPTANPDMLAEGLAAVAALRHSGRRSRPARCPRLRTRWRR